MDFRLIAIVLVASCALQAQAFRPRSVEHMVFDTGRGRLLFVESGLPGFLSSSWAMVVAPAATPRDIVDRLSSEAGKAIKSAEMQAKFVNMGVVGVGNTAAEAEAFLRAEVQKWGKVVREANVKIDQ